MKTKLPTAQSNPDPVAALLSLPEGLNFETKRVSGKLPHKALETIIAFANTKGGNLVLGLEDIRKAQGAGRLSRIVENPESGSSHDGEAP